MTVDVGRPSFFSFFDPIRMPDEEDIMKGKLTVTREDVEKEEAEPPKCAVAKTSEVPVLEKGEVDLGMVEAE